MSACTKYREELVLLHYHELAEGERLDLEAHLQVCANCRQELAELEQLAGALPKFSVSDTVLLPTRRALFYKLRAGRSSRQPSPLWNIGKLAIQVGFAVLLVFFGFKLGQQQKPAQPANPLLDVLTASRMISTENGTISPYLLGVEKITIDADGAVEISYNTVNDVRLQGRGDNPAVRQMLQYALLNNADETVQLRAVKAVEQLAVTTNEIDESFITAFEQILNEDKNVGLKLAVIKILQTLRASPQAHELLVRVMLSDKNEAVRIQAFMSLTESGLPADSLAKVLATTKTDSNTYIRTKSLELLQERKETSL